VSLSPSEEQLLLRAIALARSARKRGNHPFGAVLADAAGAVLFEAENTVSTEADCTNHAELNLVRLSSRELDDEALRGSTLYSSTEPCAMCAGGIFWAGIGRVVFALGADELRDISGDGDGAGHLTLTCREVFARGGRPVDVSGPHLRAEAVAVHDGFWS
jgi:tRNA(Arg) A34 adenosine deaminase TadA